MTPNRRSWRSYASRRYSRRGSARSFASSRNKLASFRFFARGFQSALANFYREQERLEFLYDSGLAVERGSSSDGFKALEAFPKTDPLSSSAKQQQQHQHQHQHQHQQQQQQQLSVPGALFEEKPQSTDDAWRKLHSDHLLLIQQREQEALARVKNNLVQMAMTRKSAKVLDNSTGLNKTLRGLCFSGRLNEAIALLWRAGIQLYPGTYSLLLQECIFSKQYRFGRRVHAQMVVVGFVPNEYLLTKLLILYAKAGDLETSNILFNKLPETSLISWNAIIAGHVQKGLVEIGLSLYYKMRYSGWAPDQYTFASVFRACATLATLEQGKQAHGLFIKSQISRNVVVNTALMDMYFKCSSPSDACLVFDKSLDRNVITWTALISGYGQNGSVKEVLQFFQRMINEGYRPNYVTFLAVLSACSHGGLVHEGWEYFSSMMRDYGIQPRGKHYAAMVDLLGRSGRLQEAYDFVQNSPYQGHSVIWGALLGACQIHGNMDMVKLAAKKFFELEQENAGKYVVLCNAYATFGLWDSVAEMRGQMKEFGMKKEPGYSMIEVQKEVHFFFMGNDSQEQNQQIQELINDLTCSLKDAGYIPYLSS